MSYQKQNFKSGEILKAKQMAAIDETLYEALGVSYSTSPNLWSPRLSTSDLTGRYWFKGEPYSSTNFDQDYQATEKIYIENGAPPFAKLVAPFERGASYRFYAIPVLANGYTTPWTPATGTRVMFFDADDAYLGEGTSSTETDTITVPTDAAYFRFNIYTATSNVWDGIIDSINSRLMVVDAGIPNPDAYTEYGEQIGTPIGIVPRLEEDFYSKSPNLWGIELTLDDLTGKYYFNGAPYDQDTFDSSHQATDKIWLTNSAPDDAKLTIDMVQGAEYCFHSIDALPNGYHTPWRTNIQSTIMFYDSADNFINFGNVNASETKNTMTVPNNAAYFRFNVSNKNGDGVFNTMLSAINNKMMVVSTDNDVPSKYVAYGELQKKDIIAEVLETRPIFYNIENGAIDVISHYTKDYDLRYHLQKKGPNEIFDYDTFYLVDRTLTGEVASDISGTKTLVSWHGTDSHGPFVMYATENIDGDNLNDSGGYNGFFTGGNHDYNNTGTGGEGLATGRTAIIRLYADGHEVTNGSGYCNQLKIYWENYCQATNTTKIDGTGREVLRETHETIFDGYEWHEEIKLIPLETITCTCWYGIQCIQCGSFYTKALYQGMKEADAQRAPVTLGVETKCNSNTARTFHAYNDSHCVELEIDNTYDLGTGWLHTMDYNLFTTTAKAYFRIIDGNQTLAKDNVYTLRVVYRWKPMMDNLDL